MCRLLRRLQPYALSYPMLLVMLMNCSQTRFYRQGVPRWPHRKIKSITRSISSLQAALGKNPEEDLHLNDEISKLTAQRDHLLKNPTDSRTTTALAASVYYCAYRLGTVPTSKTCIKTEVPKRNLNRKAKGRGRREVKQEPCESRTISHDSPLSLAGGETAPVEYNQTIHTEYYQEATHAAAQYFPNMQRLDQCYTYTAYVLFSVGVVLSIT